MSLRSAEDSAHQTAPLQHSIVRAAGLRVVAAWEHDRWRTRSRLPSRPVLDAAERAGASAAALVDASCVAAWEAEGLRVVPAEQAEAMRGEDWGAVARRWIPRRLGCLGLEG